ncbi:TPA: DEAD/DEAH box helicase family protein, partial [Corynebacterium striatum]|nr:DEAD/DEAH box helicase family protein [Corynebacterium striatum]
MALSNFTYDPALVTELAAIFGLRKANIRALDALTKRLEHQDTGDEPVVMDMATGAGKTYVMAAFIEYLRRQGHRNVMVVTPGLVVQKKTVANFTAGSRKYIAGAPVEANVITPDNYTTTHTAQADFTESGASNIYVFNVQQLIAPNTLEGETKSGGRQATARGIRKFSEYVGVLYDDLAALDDLVILADEHHLYSASAKAFNAAIRDLKPAVTVGFTASAGDGDDVVFRYTLREAIADKSVKQPVIAYRKDGYGDNGRYQQLKDALALLDVKARHYEVYADAHPDKAPITPVMLVVCEDIAHAKDVEEMLVSPDFFGDPYAVLRVDSDSMTDEKATLLDELDSPDSPVRAVVSVNKLKEGWDTRSIAVMVTLRAMDSDILTQQTLGRGLRLPFGTYTDEEPIDTLDVVAHESFRRLLDSEKVLRSFGVEKVQVPQPDPSPQPDPAPAVAPAPAPTTDPDPAPQPGGGDGA